MYHGHGSNSAPPETSRSLHGREGEFNRGIIVSLKNKEKNGIIGNEVGVGGAFGTQGTVHSTTTCNDAFVTLYLGSGATSYCSHFFLRYDTWRYIQPSCCSCQRLAILPGLTPGFKGNCLLYEGLMNLNR